MNLDLVEQRGWRRILAIATVGAVAAFGLIVAPQQSAHAVNNRTKADKVTICHRTHSVTNPYRMITVSTSAVDSLLNPSNPSGGNPSAGDHAGYVHNKVTAGSPDVHQSVQISGSAVFDPGFAYSGNNKIWEDIIPPFTVVRQNGQSQQNIQTYSYPGLNWSPEGQAIYYGLTYNGVDYSGLCSSMGDSEYASLERANGQQDSDILNDLNEDRQDGTNNPPSLPNLNNLQSEPIKPKGPTKPARYTQRLNSNKQNNDDVTNNVQGNSGIIKQSLAGLVWKDMNRNGLMDNGEEPFSSVGISVIDPVTGKELTSADLGLTPGTDYSLVSYSSSVAKSQVFTFANFFGGATFKTAVNTITITTDANGYFEVPYLPDGDWQVVVTTPDGWSYTYDSSGASDGDMPGTVVPVGGAGFAWAGLVYTGTSGSSSGAASSSALASTGMDTSWYVAGVIALQLIAAGGILMWLRRRNESK